MVTDDGVGMSPKAGGGAPDRGLGMESMATRMEQVGGALEVSAQEGGGTRVVATFRPRRRWWTRGDP